MFWFKYQNTSPSSNLGLKFIRGNAKILNPIKSGFELLEYFSTPVEKRKCSSIDWKVYGHPVVIINFKDAWTAFHGGKFNILYLLLVPFHLYARRLKLHEHIGWRHRHDGDISWQGDAFNFIAHLLVRTDLWNIYQATNNKQKYCTLEASSILKKKKILTS